MRRREFLAGLGGAMSWPFIGRAQTPSVAVVGVLSGTSLSPPFAAFRKGLSEASYVEDQNVSVLYRWAEGQYERLPNLASELVQQRVAVMVATGGVQSALAAKAATRDIPIVFANGSDPVRFGLVDSLKSAGGQHYWRQFLHFVVGGQAAGAPTRAIALSFRNYFFGKPNHSKCRSSVERRSGSCQDASSKSERSQGQQ